MSPRLSKQLQLKYILQKVSLEAAAGLSSTTNCEMATGLYLCSYPQGNQTQPVPVPQTLLNLCNYPRGGQRGMLNYFLISLWVEPKKTFRLVENKQQHNNQVNKNAIKSKNI